MPTVKFNSGIANHMTGSNGLGSSSSSAWGLNHTSARIRIMKGTIPTQNELDNLSFPFRDADVLIEQVSSSDTYVFTGSANWPGGRMQWVSQMVQATATGTASWFLWQGSSSLSVNYAKVAVAGTVTLPGGGGDISLTNLSIVSGDWYDISMTNFQIPRSISW